MKTPKDIASIFVAALAKKNIEMVIPIIADKCKWFTGNHFGTFIGKQVCLTHLNKIFISFPTLEFSSRWVACDDQSCVFEYIFAEKNKIYSQRNKNFNGVFILEVADDKIQGMRNYYEDRTISPRNKPTKHKVTSASKGTQALTRKDYPGYDPKAKDPYDPITGLPLK